MGEVEGGLGCEGAGESLKWVPCLRARVALVSLSTLNPISLKSLCGSWCQASVFLSVNTYTAPAICGEQHPEELGDE